MHKVLQSAKSADKPPIFIQQQYEFAAHIRDPIRYQAPKNIEDRRMKIYCELFYNNIQSLLTSTFPVLKKILSDEQWHRLIRDFFARHQSYTPLFPQISKEFINYLETEFEFADEYPAFLSELAYYEWVELGLSIDSREINWDQPNDNLLTTRPILSPLAWLMAYRFPVHQISPDYQPQTPPAELTYLVVYRNRDDDVGFTELNAVSARILTLLSEQDSKLTGQQILEQIAEELQHPNPEIVIQGGLHIMQQFVEKDILIGIEE